MEPLSMFTRPAASRLSFICGGPNLITVGSFIPILGVPAWLMSRKNWSTKSRASWKSPSFISSAFRRRCASPIWENTAPTIKLRIAITSNSSSKLNPRCFAAGKLRLNFIMLCTLSHKAAHGNWQRECLHVGSGAFHFCGNDDHLGVGGRLRDGPANVVDHLPVTGAAVCVIHLIAGDRGCRHVHVSRTR